MLVDAPGIARGHREAPEIDGVVQVPTSLDPGTFHAVTVTGALGPDLDAVPADPLAQVPSRPTTGAGAGLRRGVASRG